MRTAATLVKTACRFHSDITVFHGDQKADAKSLMSVVTLEAAYGADVTILATGRDATEAIVAMVELLMLRVVASESAELPSCAAKGHEQCPSRW